MVFEQLSDRLTNTFERLRGRPRVTHAEIEFRAGLVHGEAVVVNGAERADGFALWLTVDGDVRASMLVGCAP